MGVRAGGAASHPAHNHVVVGDLASSRTSYMTVHGFDSRWALKRTETKLASGSSIYRAASCATAGHQSARAEPRAVSQCAPCSRAIGGPTSAVEPAARIAAHPEAARKKEQQHPPERREWGRS